MFKLNIILALAVTAVLSVSVCQLSQYAVFTETECVHVSMHVHTHVAFP
jgi:hypothetical protein